MSTTSSGIFRWIKDLFRALLDLIYPKKQKKQNRKKDSAIMAKKLVLSTG